MMKATVMVVNESLMCAAGPLAWFLPCALET